MKLMPLGYFFTILTRVAFVTRRNLVPKPVTRDRRSDHAEPICKTRCPYWQKISAFHLDLLPGSIVQVNVPLAERPSGDSVPV